MVEANDHCEFCHSNSGSFRVQSKAVLLTYNGVRDMSMWAAFKAAVSANLKRWGVLYYGASLERCRNGKLHVHIMLQFHKKIDQPRATFEVLALKPNVRPGGGDYLHEKWVSHHAQSDINRGFFYVFANKRGTVLDDAGEAIYWGNYGPDWYEHTKFHFEVNATWPQKLWKRHKLDHDVWEAYMLLCREGLQARQNNLKRVREAEQKRDNAAERKAVVARFQADPSKVVEFKTFAVIEQWRKIMLEERQRYPILIIVGESLLGKTQLAKSIFHSPLQLNIGTLALLQDAMRTFNRKRRGSMVLDDARDLEFSEQPPARAAEPI